MNDELLNEIQAAELLGNMSPRTLQNWRCAKEGPPYLKVGGKVLYRRSSLQAWLERCERNHEAA